MPAAMISLALTNRHLDHRDKWSARVHLHNRATHVHLQRLSRILDERGAHCLEFAANLLPSAAKPVAMEDVVVTVGTSHVVAVGRDLGVRELAPRHASSSRMLRFCRKCFGSCSPPHVAAIARDRHGVPDFAANMTKRVGYDQ